MLTLAKKTAGLKTVALNATTRFSRLQIAALLALILLVSTYLFAPWFGVYADDYIWVHFLIPMTWPLRTVLFNLPAYWLHWIACEARPLFCTASTLLAWLTGRASSVLFGYLLGYLIHLTNAALLLVIARRLLGLFGGLAAVLACITFLPDASKILLMHRPLYLSFTLLLIAILFYQSRRYILAYACVCGTLLLYESFYFPFLLAPLFELPSRKLSVRQFAVHLAVAVSLALLLMLARSHSGDPRLSLTDSPFAALSRMLTACLIGCWTCARYSLGSGLVDGVCHTNWVYAALSVLAAGLIYQVLRSSTTTGSAASGQRNNVSPGAPVSYRVVIGAALALASAYVLMFRQEYFPPVQTDGRLSGEHAAAVFGWSLLVGVAARSLEGIGRRHLRILCAAAAIYFGLAVNHGLTVQDGQWVKSWAEQRTFWQQLLAYTDQFDEDTAILVDGVGFTDGRGVGLQDFLCNQATDVLPLFVKLPRSWKGHPRIFGVYLQPGPAGTLEAEYPQFDRRGDGVRLHVPAWSPADTWPVIRNGNFCVFSSRNNVLFPVERSLRLQNIVIAPKRLHAPDGTGPQFTRTYRVVGGML
jgi:hypothetical protein